MYYKYSKNKRYVVYYAIFSILVKLSVILMPLITEQLVNAATNKNQQIFSKFTIYYIVITILFMTFRYFSSKSYTLAAGEIEYEIKNEIFNKITYGSYMKINEKDVGFYLQRYNKDVEGMEFIFFQHKIDFIINMFYTIAILVAMVYLDYRIPLMLMVVVPLFIFLNKKIIPIIQHRSSKYFENQEVLSGYVEMAYNGSLGIRASKHQEKINDSYKQNMNITKKSMFKYLLLDEKYNVGVVDGILNFCNIFVYCYGGLLLFNNIITVGTLMAFVIYFSRIWDPIAFYLGYKKKVSKAKVSESRVLEILNIKCDAQSDEKKEKIDNVWISNILFSINDKEIITDANIRLDKNHIYYVTGANGSGKTTFFNLIAEIYNTDKRVEINSKVHDKNTVGLKENCYYVTADVYNLPSRISDNISEDTYMKYPINHHKYDDQISSLSSGEQKKLQLIRSIERSESIIIFDEPLNYLDKSNIKFFTKIIDHIKMDKIIIISSHEEDIKKICTDVIEISNAVISNS